MAIAIGIGIGLNRSKSTSWTTRQLAAGLKVINDGTTLGWYDASDDTTITKDGANLVSLWKDKLLSGRDFAQADDNFKPIKKELNYHFGEISGGGIMFAGTDEYMKVILTAAQPFNIYVTYRHHTAQVASDPMLNAKDPIFSYFRFVVQPVGKYSLYLGTGWCGETNILFNNYFGTTHMKADGVNSFIKVNRVIGDVGSGGNNGFTSLEMGGSTVYAKYGHYEIVEMIIRGNDTDIQAEAVKQYLNVKNFDVFSKGKILLTFDGNRENIYNQAFPILVEEGVKGTMYTYGGGVGTVGAYTWANTLEMYNAGMDIQCHSFTHPGLETQTDEEIIAEMENNNAAFIANGLPSPEHIAYPFAALSLNTQNIVKNYRKSGRRTEIVDFKVMWRRYMHQYSIHSYPIENITAPNLVILKSYMDFVALNGSYITLYHHFTNAADAAGLATFREIITYGKSIGLEFVTISQLYNQIAHL